MKLRYAALVVVFACAACGNDDASAPPDSPSSTNDASTSSSVTGPLPSSTILADSLPQDSTTTTAPGNESPAGDDGVATPEDEPAPAVTPTGVDYCSWLSDTDFGSAGVVHKQLSSEDTSTSVRINDAIPGGSCRWTLQVDNGTGGTSDLTVQLAVATQASSADFENVVADELAYADPSSIDGLGDRNAYGSDPDGYANLLVVQKGSSVMFIGSDNYELVSKSASESLARTVLSHLD